ncbi:hypothetical protein [Labilibacter marinus]|uniref:hypothetical protein n=1 Tax=Labilibacter marinus TaxID=1477105 RepID=UPI000829A926|nr:hypothetical protein [Labilibacter marinus]
MFLHHPESKTGYGNLRIVFKDQDDFLIDDWIYLPEVEIEEDDFDEMEITPISMTLEKESKKMQ